MRVRYSVWLSGRDNYNVERIVDTYDKEGLLRDFENAIDLRELQAENRELKKHLAGCAVTGCAICAREIPPVVAEAPRHEAAVDFGHHVRVFDYDGAMRCFDCEAQWGALPDKSVMPAVCEPPKPKPTIKDLLALIEFGHWGGARVDGIPEVHGYRASYEDLCPVCARLGAYRRAIPERE